MKDSILWKSYEEVSTYLLSKCAEELGLAEVEGKQKLKGHKSGTEWEIDAKGIREGDKAIIIIECRRVLSGRRKQGELASLAYIIQDTGAAGGILVSPTGFQKGANKIANSENILNVHIDQKSTKEVYFLKFLNKLIVGLHEAVTVKDQYSAKVFRTCSNCLKQFELKNNEQICPHCREGS